MLKEKIAAQAFEPQYQALPWRASQVGDPCETRLWHIRAGSKPLPYPGRVRHLLDDGRKHELDVVERLVRAGFQVYHSCLDKQLEVVVSTEPFVVGHPDGILHCNEAVGEMDYFSDGFDKGQKYFLLEVTAPNHFLFHNIKLRHLREAYPAKWVQVQMYLHSEVVASFTDSAVVVVKNKNTSELYEEGVVYDPDAVRYYLERLKRIEEMVEKGTPPAHRCDDPRWCAFRHLCFPDASPTPPVETPPRGALVGESLQEGEQLKLAVQLWREGRFLYSKGLALMEEAREYFRSVLRDYGAGRLIIDNVEALIVQQDRRSCDLAVLRERFPDAYSQAVSIQRVESLRVREIGGERRLE